MYPDTKVILIDRERQAWFESFNGVVVQAGFKPSTIALARYVPQSRDSTRIQLVEAIRVGVVRWREPLICSSQHEPVMPAVSVHIGLTCRQGSRWSCPCMSIFSATKCYLIYNRSCGSSRSPMMHSMPLWNWILTGSRPLGSQRPPVHDPHLPVVSLYI